jgi:hypothetical protein
MEVGMQAKRDGTHQSPSVQRVNANTVLSTTVASGRTFGAITAIMPPRIVRFGGTFSF